MSVQRPRLNAKALEAPGDATYYNTWVAAVFRWMAEQGTIREDGSFDPQLEPAPDLLRKLFARVSDDYRKRAEQTFKPRADRRNFALAVAYWELRLGNMPTEIPSRPGHRELPTSRLDMVRQIVKGWGYEADLADESILGIVEQPEQREEALTYLAQKVPHPEKIEELRKAIQERAERGR